MDELLIPALRKAVDYLEKNGYRYAIIGGIAVSHWGFVRHTQDVDIKVLVPNTEYPAARKMLRTAFPNPAREHIKNNPLIVAVDVDGVIVDFLLALPGYEELIIERAVHRDFGGWSAWVCSAEDLIIQKVVAGRGKDWPDVEALLIEQRGKLDEAYIEDWLSQFAEALEESELLEKYQRLLEEVERYYSQ
ncbi:MAG: nucleotidyltransferase [Chloroflexi bacterium]|nr:nucleotidyltransferase [Chloroflexota bacterium]